MKVPQNKFVDVLRDTVIECLESGHKGSKLPALHAYLEMDGEDIDNKSVKQLRNDFSQVLKAIPNLHIGLYQEGKFVPVDYISGTARLSNPDAGFFLTAVGVDRDFPAREKLEEMVRASINTCDEAIKRNCGFGKYTKY